ncbi:MAG: tetratricopeptide repeat protein [Saprospiraceae bacterium]|nr:tetratricopeptide repeat protein [Saprospiraceae bacterium]
MKNLLGSCLLLLLALCLGLGCQTQEVQDGQVVAKNIIPELERLNALIQSNLNDGNLRFQRGAMYYDQGRYPEAIIDLQKSTNLDSLDVEAWHLLADALLDNLQSREALETMETTAKLFHSRIPTLLKLSEFQLILKRYSEAMTTLRQIQSIESQNPDAYFMKGMVFKENGDTAQAIAQFQLATKENPKLIDAWINLGHLLEAQNNPDALRYFDAGLTISPGHRLILHAKSQYLARANRIEEAKAVYRQMIEIEPYDSEPYYDLGLLYLDQDSLIRAAAHFDLRMKIDPLFVRAYFYRGLTRELMGEIDGARIDYEQTLQIDPKNMDAGEALKRLNQGM